MNTTELITIYNKQSKKLADTMRQFLVVYGVGIQPQASTSARMKALRAKKKIKEQAETIEDVLNKASEQWAENAVVKAANSGFKQAQIEIMKTRPERLANINFGGIQKKVTAVLIRDSIIKSNNYNGTIKPLINKALRVSKLTAKQDSVLSEQLAIGKVQGETIDQLSKRIVRNLSLDDGNRVMLINGKSWDGKAYARTFTRTRTAEASDIALGESAKAVGINTFKISYHPLKQPHDPYCTTLQGKVFASGKNKYGFPVITKVKINTKSGTTRAKWPPFHPNCRHSRSIFDTIAYSENEIKAELSKSKTVI